MLLHALFFVSVSASSLLTNEDVFDVYTSGTYIYYYMQYIVVSVSASSPPTMDDICDIYTSGIDGCAENYECAVTNSVPSCK